MLTELLQHWQIAVDGLQIFLCLLILFFLMRNYRRRLKIDMMSANNPSNSNFNFQVFTEAIHQQVELAFTNILQVVDNERRNLDKVLQFQQLKYTESASKQMLSPAPASHRDSTHLNMTEAVGQSKRQDSIRQLATQGMSAKQISDELKTPLGEVELVLSLQKQ
jgi:hypothetical protein